MQRKALQQYRKISTPFSFLGPGAKSRHVGMYDGCGIVAAADSSIYPPKVHQAAGGRVLLYAARRAILSASHSTSVRQVKDLFVLRFPVYFAG